jgi:hypothetical protein
MMDWKVFAMKRSWPNLRLYSGIGLEELSKTTKNLSHDSRFLGRDLNAGSPKHKTGVTTTFGSTHGGHKECIKYFNWKTRKGKRSLDRPRCRWDYNTQLNLKSRVCVDWTYLSWFDASCCI